MYRGSVVLAREVFRHRQPIAPRQPAVAAPLQHRVGPAVAERIGHEHRLVVPEQHRVGLPQVQAIHLVYDYAPVHIPGKVD